MSFSYIKCRTLSILFLSRKQVEIRHKYEKNCPTKKKDQVLKTMIYSSQQKLQKSMVLNIQEI